MLGLTSFFLDIEGDAGLYWGLGLVFIFFVVNGVVVEFWEVQEFA